MPMNPSCPFRSRPVADWTCERHQPKLSICRNNESDGPKIQPLYSLESSASEGMREAYHSFTAGQAKLQNLDSLRRDNSETSEFAMHSLSTSSHFSVASSSSPGKPFSSSRKDYHTTGNLSCHSVGEGSQTVQERNPSKFSSNDQPLATERGRNEATGFYSSRGQGFGALLRGPRGNRRLGDSSSSSSTSSVARDSSSSNSFLYWDKFNLPDFRMKYDQAKFFVIKSFIEDDIHKSIKYNVWSSTLYGNKKLNCAYHDAEAKLDEGIKCPIFLFFSVNGSGQFVGVAEMFGPVDFNKTMDFWQEDNWHGFFPVKWHIIKDVPSSLFRNIILENNDYKPVTSSRDTQEVEIHHGLTMLSIFKDFRAITCILDDFAFYEEKERFQKGHIRTAARQAPMTHRQEQAEPVKKAVTLSGFEKRPRDRDAAFLAALTGKLSIQSSQERTRKHMK